MTVRDQPGRSVWILAAVAVVIGALDLAQGVLVPLTLAVLLSFLLSPVCNWLERRKFGRIPAVSVTVLVGFALLGAATWTAVAQMSELAPRVPEYKRNVQAKLRSVNDVVSAALSNLTTTAAEVGTAAASAAPEEKTGARLDQPYAVRVVETPPSAYQLLSGTFGTIIEVLSSTGVVLLLVVFFLVSREDMRDRFVSLVGRAHLTVTTQALEDAASRVSRYLATQFFLNLCFGIPFGIGLYFIGVP
ncbi:MAG: AI-2E family transporter, partial [Planctomycetaceae bacterium]